MSLCPQPKGCHRRAPARPWPFPSSMTETAKGINRAPPGTQGFHCRAEPGLRFRIRGFTPVLRTEHRSKAPIPQQLRWSQQTVCKHCSESYLQTGARCFRNFSGMRRSDLHEPPHFLPTDAGIPHQAEGGAANSPLASVGRMSSRKSWHSAASSGGAAAAARVSSMCCQREKPIQIDCTAGSAQQ